MIDRVKFLFKIQEKDSSEEALIHIVPFICGTKQGSFRHENVTVGLQERCLFSKRILSAGILFSQRFL